MKTILTKDNYRTELRKLQKTRSEQLKKRVGELMKGKVHGEKEVVYYQVAAEFGYAYSLVRNTCLNLYPHSDQ